jgi:hypothetical protein
MKLRMPYATSTRSHRCARDRFGMVMTQVPDIAPRLAGGGERVTAVAVPVVDTARRRPGAAIASARLHSNRTSAHSVRPVVGFLGAGPSGPSGWSPPV